MAESGRDWPRLAEAGRMRLGAAPGQPLALVNRSLLGAILILAEPRRALLVDIAEDVEEGLAQLEQPT